MMAGWIPKILWGGAAAALIAGGVVWYKGRGDAEPKWRTAPVERGPLQVSVTATGTLQAVVTVQVGTQVSGTVSAIYADFNSQVKKGQVIARIDTTLLRAALSDALSNQEKAEAQARQAEDERKRTQALFERDLVSQSDLDQAVANARVAQANFSSAKAQVDRARINLRYATIISPIDGTVLSRAVDVGQTVAASFNTPTLFTIAGDLRQMEVQASVDEADIGKVKLGQRSTFTVDAYPDTMFAGEVKQIRLNPVVNQNVVSYTVVISVPNPDMRLMPGMTANLNIAVSRKEDALQVPTAALRFAPPGMDESQGKGGWKKRADAGGNPGNTQDTQAAGPAQAGRSGWRRGDSAQGGSGGTKGAWAARGDSAGAAARRGANGNGGTGGVRIQDGRDRSRGRVWILDGKTPKAVDVRVGLSDGSHTEIDGPLNPGTQVIVGMETAKSAGAQGASPFGMSRMGGRGGAGGAPSGGARFH